MPTRVDLGLVVAFLTIIVPFVCGLGAKEGHRLTHLFTWKRGQICCDCCFLLSPVKTRLFSHSPFPFVASLFQYTRIGVLNYQVLNLCHVNSLCSLLLDIVFPKAKYLGQTEPSHTLRILQITVKLLYLTDQMRIWCFVWIWYSLPVSGNTTCRKISR